MTRIVRLFSLTVLLLSVSLVPRSAAVARTAHSQDLACSGQTTATPMAGHYTGPWHSDGDYHFAVFNTDLDLKITINGTLDAIMDTSGHLSGTATGTVDAPITHDGARDVSSGYGTITGQLSGVFSGSGTMVLLSQAVIHMHWGTFVPGGYTVDRSVSMPNYQFPLTSADCVSSEGSITETNFPVMTVTSDGTGGITQAPGLGSASGSWQLTSDAAARFTALSLQVDTFVTQANAYLSGATFSFAGFQKRVDAPLRDLVTRIQTDQGVARCLLERLGSWAAAALSSLDQQNHLSATPTLIDLRRAGDLLRSTHLIAQYCGVADIGVWQALYSAQNAALDRALQARNWSETVLVLREALLTQGNNTAAQVNQEILGRLHVMLVAATDRSALLELARVAYALGDDADAMAAYHRLVSRPLHLSSRIFAHKPKKHKKKRKPTPPANPTPSPTATSTPTPPAPPTFDRVLYGGAVTMTTHVSAGPQPSLDWLPVAGAARYLVVVTVGSNGTPLWSWSGSATSVQYGDATLPDLPGSGDDGWPNALPGTGYTWSVLALDGAGHIVGLKVRVTG